MPFYQYRCLDCKKRFEIRLSYQEYGEKSVNCLHCESGQVQRSIGRIRFARSEESRLESLADPAALEGIEDDPKAMAKLMRTMGSEMGEEMPPEFDEVVNRLESGQSPEEIEEALPDLGGMDDFGGDDF